MIDWREDGVWMTGPTAHVFSGTLTPSFWERVMSAPIFSNHGCRLNAYETEAMKELAAEAGLRTPWSSTPAP